MKAVTIIIGKNPWSVFLCANEEQCLAAFNRMHMVWTADVFKDDRWITTEPDYAGLWDSKVKGIFIPIRGDQFFVFRAVMYRLAEAAIYELISSGISSVELGRLLGALASQYDKNFWLDLMCYNREAKV